MPTELVKRAIGQARDHEPLVRAMTLIYGARVLAAVDKQAARQAFAEGVTGLQQQLGGRRLDMVLREVVRIGARAHPDAAIAQSACSITRPVADEGARPM